MIPIMQHETIKECLIIKIVKMSSSDMLYALLLMPGNKPYMLHFGYTGTPNYYFTTGLLDCGSTSSFIDKYFTTEHGTAGALVSFAITIGLWDCESTGSFIFHHYGTMGVLDCGSTSFPYHFYWTMGAWE